jgi:hypothetical protein
MTAPKSGKTPTQKATDKLTESSPQAGIELTEAELSNVSAGRKAGKGQQEFLVVKMNDVIIT